MDATTPVNGHEPPDDEEMPGTNPYADAVRGTKPREIIDFELNMDPYARMLGVPPPGVSVPSSQPNERIDRPGIRRLMASLLAIAVLLFAILYTGLIFLPH